VIRSSIIDCVMIYIDMNRFFLCLICRTYYRNEDRRIKDLDFTLIDYCINNLEFLSFFELIYPQDIFENKVSMFASKIYNNRMLLSSEYFLAIISLLLDSLDYNRITWANFHIYNYHLSSCWITVIRFEEKNKCLLGFNICIVVIYWRI